MVVSEREERAIQTLEMEEISPKATVAEFHEKNDEKNKYFSSIRKQDTRMQSKVTLKHEV